MKHRCQAPLLIAPQAFLTASKRTHATRAPYHMIRVLARGRDRGWKAAQATDAPGGWWIVCYYLPFLAATFEHCCIPVYVRRQPEQQTHQVGGGRYATIYEYHSKLQRSSTACLCKEHRPWKKARVVDACAVSVSKIEYGTINKHALF